MSSPTPPRRVAVTCGGIALAPEANAAVARAPYELGAVNQEALVTTVVHEAGTVLGMMEAELQ